MSIPPINCSLIDSGLITTRCSSIVISIALVFFVFFGCAETNVDTININDKADETTSSDAELSRRLDQVGTLEVAQCLVLVEVTVATAGNSARIISALGKMGRGLAAIDDAVTYTVAGWLTAAGVESSAAGGVSWILVKVAELAGLPTAGDLAKSTILLLVNTALELAESCLLVAQTYWDGIKSLPYVFGYEPAVEGCLDYDGLIECQRTCGVSISEQEQVRLWGIPNECQFEPLQSSIRQARINGYLRFCLERMCRQGGSTPPTFNSCTWQGSPEERELITGWPPLEQRCEEAKEVALYLEEDTMNAPPVEVPNGGSSADPNSGSSNVPSISSCTGLFECEQECAQAGQGQACTNSCYERVSNPEAISLVNQLYVCASTYQCADITCLEQNCAESYSACGFELSNLGNGGSQGGSEPPTDPTAGTGQGGNQGGTTGGSNNGGFTCEEIWNCLVDCPDQSCADTCILSGNTQAQQDVLALLECYSLNESLITTYEELYSYCPDESFTCFSP